MINDSIIPINTDLFNKVETYIICIFLNSKYTRHELAIKYF